MTKIRLVLSSVASKNFHLEQLDVKTTFLHDDLEEDIYMAQPEGFQSAKKEENLVCKLKKSLYGLKQAPRQWYLKFDILCRGQAGFDMAKIKKLMRQLSQEFVMKDLGSAKQILGMSIIRDKNERYSNAFPGEIHREDLREHLDECLEFMSVALCHYPEAEYMAHAEKLKLWRATSTGPEITDEAEDGSLPQRKRKVRAITLLKGRWLRAEGPRLRAEGSDVNLTKRTRGRTLLTQKLLRILLLSRVEED
ncbi:retrovirus-related pol polyprotein from transposon TNT 1-94 [Tanacetum coccineum]